MPGDGAVVVVGGTRAIGFELVRHYVGEGSEVVLTGQSPDNVASAVAEAISLIQIAETGR